MILAAAFCPHPPALVAGMAGTAQGEVAAKLAAVRDASLAAIHAIAGPERQLVVLGVGLESAAHSPLAQGSLASYGLPGVVQLGSPACGGADELPLSLTVGAWLIREALGASSGAIGFSVGPDFASSHAAVELLARAEHEALALVVLGDGSARRALNAPGYLDERAGEFDAAVAAALAGGDPDALGGVDRQLGEQLLCAGVPAWHAAAAVLSESSYHAELTYDDAPFGVGYFVAQWSRHQR